MIIQYFEDTDTLYITFSQKSPRETREIDENTILDLDEFGQLCGMTIEQVKGRVGSPEVKYKKIPAYQ